MLRRWMAWPRTARRLGAANVLRVATYRAGIATGLHPVCRVSAALPDGPFFNAAAPERPSSAAVPSDLPLFGWIPLALAGDPPDWHRNVLTGERAGNPDQPGWRVAALAEASGDIKGIWEPSRFAWVVRMAARARNGDAQASATIINRWMADWARVNPAFAGPNWACGQEASFRVLHLAVAALMLGEASRPLAPLLDFVEAHLRRIAPTIAYAIGQDNNHGTSEAAALMVGGLWLEHSRPGRGATWTRIGRKWLENRAARLFESDGTFSQYSLNYHRLALDTLSIAELWRRAFGAAPFSSLFYSRAAAAAEWLTAMIAGASGDGPNTGTNDGAWLLPLGEEQRDFRPSAQLASVLFGGRRAIAARGPWDVLLESFSVDATDAAAPPHGGQLFNAGGYALLRQGGALAMMRFPRFRFRPAHADALHVDLWVNGENHLRDAGSFSYNTTASWYEYFSGTRGHNTVEFDGRDQMPRLGRFLFSEWLAPEPVAMRARNPEGESFAAGYRDSQGARHERRVHLGPASLHVSDTISGDFRAAVLRWRLRPASWHVSGHSVAGAHGELRVACTRDVSRFEIVEGWESRYYGRRTPVPVLEVEVRGPCEWRTDYSWRVS